MVATEGGVEDQTLLRLGLKCLPRPSYGNQSAWTHSLHLPSYKVARVCITSLCDHLRATHKLLPTVAADAEFALCDRIWWFGFLRCLQIQDAEQFYPFRADFVGHLMPEYKRVFGRRYSHTQVCLSLFYFLCPPANFSS